MIPGVRSARFKNLLNVPLYEYQREGALFAARAGKSGHSVRVMNAGDGFEV